ncbi:MAG: HPP family protein [Gammaproteobacteria bacterium]|nr:HPP family protein [Gammaproteobacteria bacterium]
MRHWRMLLGIENTPISHGEKWISFSGSIVAILLVFSVSKYILGNQGAAIIVASIGASAVLLFATPHSQLAQPWPVVGGHVISALVGVTCAQWVPNELLAAGASVSIAIVAMFYLRCLHPPGGATALAAVVGGEAIQALDYQYVITPILLDALLIVAVAMVFNNLFSSRRYPMGWFTREEKGAASAFAEPSAISHADFVYALSQLDTFVDISEQDLMRIYELATGNARERKLPVKNLKVGADYSNGMSGEEWSVRRIVDEQRHDDPKKDLVIYRVIAGKGARDTACVRREEFLSWARFEMQSSLERPQADAKK